MTWENRLRPEIKLTSPQGVEFFALWRNNERTAEKKLGMFDPPNFKGTYVQDLNVKSTMWPLTIYFHGPFQNDDAKDFFDIWTEEVGQWEIIHPVYGPLILQPVSCAEKINPVDDGSFTSFETMWIEPANIQRLISLEALAESILVAGLAAFDDCKVLLAQLRADAYSAVNSAINMLNQISNFSDSVLSELAATDALVQETYDSANAAVTDALENFGIEDPDTEPVADAFIGLVSAPLNASDDFSNNFAAYESMTDEILSITPITVTQNDYNAVTSQEFGLTITLISIAQSIVTSTFSSRADVLSAIENLGDLLNNSVESMDEIQDLYIDLDLDFQYFSQTQTYTNLVRLFSLAIQYLLQQFYNLKTEKRFEIKNPRSPIEITVSEYGSLGKDDFYYNLFLESNKLSGNDILLLPAGTEVLIYA